MTSLEAPVTDVRPEPTTDLEVPAPTERGTTTIASGVFEKIAARAAAEVNGVEGEVRTGLDRFLPWAAGSLADASADVGDDGVVVDLVLNVAYPQPVRQVTALVRRHVVDRVAEMTGRRVEEVNITVPELVVPERRPPRVR